MVQVFVTIPVTPAWPSPEELRARNSVIAAIDAARVGTCTGAGGGRGEMDFSYRVADEQAARAAIELAMQEHMPGATCRIRVCE